MGKYASLGEFLSQQPLDEVPLTFERIEQITGTRLPRSATRYRAWWSNNESNSVMTRVWLAAGFESEQVDMEGRKLIFRRVRRNKSVPSRRADDHRLAVSSRHPLFGWLKGTVRVTPGVDLTEPADPDWADGLDR